MHHAGLLLLLLVLALLLGPLVGQGLSAMGGLLAPLVAVVPGAAMLSNLAAPALVGTVIILGVGVIGVLKLVAGV